MNNYATEAAFDSQAGACLAVKAVRQSLQLSAALTHHYWKDSNAVSQHKESDPEPGHLSGSAIRSCGFRGRRFPGAIQVGGS
jgi:hypothetical protein